MDQLDLHGQKLLLDTTSDRPRFLVIQVIQEPNVLDITKSFQSLSDQKYDHWDLRFLFVGKHDHESLEKVRGLSDKDKRVDSVVCNEMLRSKDWILRELDRKEHDYVVFLDAGGLLAPYALREFAKVLDENSKLDWIYADEDFIDNKFARHSPWFKPDWSPELLLSINYLTPAVIRCELISSNLRHRQTEAGDQWLESPLTFIDVHSSKVHHCPKVLYHRLKSRKRTLSDRKANPQHHTWVSEYLSKRGLRDAGTVITSDGELRVSCSPMDEPVSILIPNRDNVRLLRKCVESIIDRTRYSNYRLILIDTGSELEETQGFYESVSEHPKVKVVQFEREFNYSQVNNYGAKIAEGEYFLFLNDDIEVVEGDWLDELLQLAQFPEIGIVGAKLHFPDESIQHNGIILGLGGHAGHVFRCMKDGNRNPFGSTQWYRNVLAVTGACMMVRRDVFKAIGGFDEAYSLVFSDVELCLRAIERGYRVAISPFTGLIHHEGATRGRTMPLSDITLAFDRFLPYLRAGDPYYNPNLSYMRTYPKIRRSHDADREQRVIQIIERMKH